MQYLIEETSYNRQLLPIDTNHYNKLCGNEKSDTFSGSLTNYTGGHQQQNLYYGCRRQATANPHEYHSYPDLSAAVATQQHTTPLGNPHYDHYYNASSFGNAYTSDGSSENNFGTQQQQHIDIKVEQQQQPNHHDEFHDTDSNSNTSLSKSMLAVKQRSHSVLTDYYNCKLVYQITK
jgi:hypothetical protein